MEQDQHERSLCRRKQMSVNIIEFTLIAVTAWGLGFARYLAEHKGVEIMHLFKISRDLSATMTAISAIGFIILVVATAAIAETSTHRHKVLLFLWSLVYSVWTALTSIIWYLGVPPQEHSAEIIPTWKKFCILASFVFQDISLDIVQALLISWIIAREKHTERAIASFGILYPIGSLVASALFLKIGDVGGIFTIPSFVVPIFVVALIIKTAKSMEPSSSSSRQKFCINSLHIFCPDTRIKNLQIWSSITYPAVFLLRSELPTLLTELDARKGDFHLEKSEEARFLVTTVADSCSFVVAIIVLVFNATKRVRIKNIAVGIHVALIIALISIFQFPGNAIIFIAAVISGPSTIIIMLLPFILLARARNEDKEERHEYVVTDVAAIMIALKVGVTLLIILLDHIMSSLSSKSSLDYEDDSVFSKQSNVGYYLMVALLTIGGAICAKLLKFHQDVDENEGRLIERNQSNI